MTWKTSNRGSNSFLSNNHIKCNGITTIRRQIQAEWIKTIIQKYIYNRLILYSETNILKLKGWKKIYHANRNQKRGEEAISKLDQVDIMIKIITGGKL